MARTKKGGGASKGVTQANSAGSAATAAAAATTTKVDETPADRQGILWWIMRIAAVACACWVAYDIRLYAIKEYGLIIHEFDPWFNYRATEYLHKHGIYEFFRWFDDRSWWPIGRPVGSTIYPGMQLTAVGIWHALEELGSPMKLNDICCYIPAWFGVSATIFTGLLTAECSGSRNAGALACLVMSCIPAHIMRSVGGGYDNESIAVTAMTMTFYFWCRSLRSDFASVPFGILSGLAYVYMVAAWGGYVFVLNMVGIHAIFLVFIGKFSLKLHRAYTLFYAIGTFGAIQIPVVGLTPLKSLEQIGPLGVFGIMQVLFVCELIRKSKKLDADQFMKLRIQAFTVAAGVGVVIVAMLYPTGYFGPLSARVRGLLVKHTRTGNPLVDSVAEHQPASAGAYQQYLEMATLLGPIGYIKSFFGLSDSKYFLVLYASIAYFFSSKMVRLIILLGPIASALSGVALAMMIEWSFDQLTTFAKPEDEEAADKGNKTNSSKKSKQTKSLKTSNPLGPEMDALINQANVAYERNGNLRKIAAFVLTYLLFLKCRMFYGYCRHMAQAMSNPSIVFNAQLRDGTKVKVNDYVEAYEWLRDEKNTPYDARILAWWDYGYQISGIADRITLADGNTWNHEHIATVGRMLVSEEVEAHRMIRHLADYVLVWAGGGGDDLAKSPHLMRIASSVYDMCDDPLCSDFGYVDRQGTPSPRMKKSLLYKLHSGGKTSEMPDPQRFTNVFNSKYHKVRIWKVEKVDEESKAWNFDKKNRDCQDAPNDWICPGNYPPKFQKFIENRRDFAQLEDFNQKKDKRAEEYNRKYMESFEKRKPKK